MTQPVDLYGGTTSAQRGLDHPNNEYFTPPALIREIKNNVFAGVIDLDPATTNSNPVGAKHFYTINEDGLKHPWSGTVFVNPPYGKGASLFAKKILFEKGFNVQIVALFAARPDSKWQQELMREADYVLFLKGRLKFADSNGVQQNTAPFGSVLVSFNCSLKPIENLGLLLRP